MNSLSQLKKELRNMSDAKRAAFSPKYFKAGSGEYAEGDKFLGVTVPHQRVIAKKYKYLSQDDIQNLLTSEWHEERLTALFILVSLFKKSDEVNKKIIFDLYLDHTRYVNNWDLVDSSAGYIVGAYLDQKSEKMSILTRLAKSDLIWERRIAMISTLHYIVKGGADEALVISGLLVNDNHDLIQKAVGWMLREVGKRVDRQLLIEFLDIHAATMPRTALRYAIEHLDPVVRRHYMNMADKV